MSKATPAIVKRATAVCMPTQTMGSSYDEALNAHRMLSEPEAMSFWTREDVGPLAESILGKMLLGEPSTYRQGEEGVREAIAGRSIVGEPDESFDEDQAWDDIDGTDMSYLVEVPTRLGRIIGSGSCWAFAMARAMAAYAELVRRSKAVIAPIPQRDAFDFIQVVHRHHFKPQGWKFGLGAWSVVNDLDMLVGVATVGRPTARMLQDQGAWEVQRVAVLEGGQNLCSALYAACWREAKERGCKRLVTFILPSESGKSLLAAGWKLVQAKAGGGSRSRAGRPRVDKAPTCVKQRWEKTA